MTQTLVYESLRISIKCECTREGAVQREQQCDFRLSQVYQLQRDM